MVEQTAERIIKFKIIIATNEALANLSALVRSTDNYNKKIEALKRLIVEFAKVHNISIRDAALQLQQFQNLLFDPSKNRTPFTDALEGLGKEAEKTETKTRSLGDVLKTALGFTLGSILVRAVRNFIGVLKEMLAVAIDAEKQLFRLNVAVIALNRVGTVANLQQFQKFIKALGEEFKIFSQVALSQATASTALYTRELGFTQNQIQETVRAGAIMAALFDGDVVKATNALTRAMVTGRTQGLAPYAAAVSRTAILERARAMGIADSLENMSKATRASIILELVTESMSQVMDEAADITETAAGKQAELSAAWTNFTQKSANFFLPAWKRFLDALITGISLAEQLSIIFRTQLAKALTVVATAAIGAGVAFGMMWKNMFGGEDFTLEDFMSTMQIVMREFEEGFRDVLGVGLGEKRAAKPLEPVIEGMEEDAQEIEDIVKKLADAIEREMLRMQQRTEELNLKFAQRLETLELQFAQRRQRIIEDFALRREKTNRQFDIKAAEAARKFHQREEEEERKFQERMIRLRERFLFDLEDAVRERDARQVLRLIRRFNMEKGQLERQREEEDQTRDERFQDEMAAIERQRAERLRQLDIDEQMRLLHLAQDHALEMRQAEERHQQELEQLRRQTENRLELVALGLTQEYDITRSGLDRIMQLLLERFGPGGFVEGIYDFMFQRLSGVGQAYLQSIANLASQGQAIFSSMALALSLGGGVQQKNIPLTKQAQGGTVIASRPTLALFGEAGLEAATFTPIGRVGTGVGRTMGGMPAGTGGGEGKLTVEVMLDPNLQTKIVDESMGRVANVITNVRRSQQ